MKNFVFFIYWSLSAHTEKSCGVNCWRVEVSAESFVEAFKAAEQETNVRFDAPAIVSVQALMLGGAK